MPAKTISKILTTAAFTLVLAACSGGGGDPRGDVTGPESNRAPAFTSIPPLTGDHNRPYVYRAEVTDPDGDPVAIRMIGPNWLSLNAATGELSGTAGRSNIRTHSVRLFASDGVAETEQSFTIEVVLGEIICNQDFGDPAQSPYILPYRAGQTFTMFQGYCSTRGGHRNTFAYDFDTMINDTIIASRAGTVIFANDQFPDGNRVSGEENNVFVQHSDGTVIRYTHLTQGGALVRTGDQVDQGTPIGLSGDTGASAGPHLHLQAFADRTSFDRQNSIPVNFSNTDGPLDTNRGLIEGQQYTAR
jgi:murein DD-endopeptidase MepM/ murein hydrolase activator NlpD